MFSLHDYNYDLPGELIAQKPADSRDRSRLLLLNRETGELFHHEFYQLYDFLAPEDILVVNNTQVIPARLLGKKDTGGKAEILILDYAGGQKKAGNSGFVCECLVKTSKRPKLGTSIFFDQELKAKIINSAQDGIYTIKFDCNGDFESILYRIGMVPLPPYIKRSKGDHRSADDRKSYQTLYASQKGAVAAPTAGFHFSEELLEEIKLKGVKIVEITLHVGYGTFFPIRVSDIREHKIHSERYSISQEAAGMINRARARGSRIVAVGTTSVRALEYSSDNTGNVVYGSGSCDLFIYPGYSFKVVDAMITNFHLPQSSLLMLVSAFAGRNKILKAYREAINKRYRFYSYGDAMFIVP